MNRDLADERTLNALDFVAIRDGLCAYARTARGRLRCEAIAPLRDPAHIRGAFARLAEVRRLLQADLLRVGQAADTSDATARAMRGASLAPSELRSVSDSLVSASVVATSLRQRQGDSLDAILAPYSSLTSLSRSIADAIDERGVVQDRASHALGRIRRDLNRSQGEARDRVAALARSSMYERAIQDSVVTVRSGRYVVPIKAEFVGEFPGVVHDTSGSGQTLFVEPLAAMEVNNRVRTLQLEEEREIARILEALSREVGANAVAIEANIEMLAAIDELCAKAELASRQRAQIPEVSEKPIAAIVNGRHPLLGERAIPQSLEISDDLRIIVVSGPNMGGKTVALKMLGLFIVMSACGLAIPADPGTRIGYFTHVIADIGDAQSILDDVSTFAAHLTRMREVLTAADAHTLALIDEIGGGTEPSAGAALAVAMLERLLSVGAAALVTTHATELKLFAHSHPGVINASMRFDAQTFVPTYRFDLGTPGQSLAFPLARTMGIDPVVITRAETLLDSRERHYEAALADVAQRAADLSDDRDRVARERSALLIQRESLQRDRAAFDAQRQAFALRADETLRKAVREFLDDVQAKAREREQMRAKLTSGQASAMDRAAAQIRATLGIDESTQHEMVATDVPLVAGLRVRSASLHSEGEVVEDYGDRVLIALGAMKTVVPKGDLTALPVKAAKRQAGAGVAALAASTHARTELDVRGQRFSEAESVVERWLDEAGMAGLTHVRLIHGKGTGQLGRGLQAWLGELESVVSYRYGNADEGGSGVTIVELQGS
ncbi:MAG: endonuclease MutS2 [Vulcanimicrobiaceae bacterium]